MRIIVRNLPPKMDSLEIKQLFSKFKEVTEIEFPTEKLRRFCFVSFRDEKSATEAIRIMHKFYVKNHKLIVEKYKQDDHNIKRQKYNILLNKKDEIRQVLSESLLVVNLPSNIIKKELRTVYNDAV